MSNTNAPDAGADTPLGATARSSGEAQATGFERAIRGLDEVGASATIRALVELLSRHGSDEGRILAEYERLAATTTDSAARYLIDLILADERRHHQTLVEIATSMAWDDIRSVETPVPTLGWHLDEALRVATRKLRDYEERDRKELKDLRRQLRPFEETTLWGLLVDLMILDTEKHARILRFLEDHGTGD